MQELEIYDGLINYLIAAKQGKINKKIKFFYSRYYQGIICIINNHKLIYHVTNKDMKKVMNYYKRDKIKKTNLILYYIVENISCSDLENEYKYGSILDHKIEIIRQNRKIEKELLQTDNEYTEYLNYFNEYEFNDNNSKKIEKIIKNRKKKIKKEIAKNQEILKKKDELNNTNNYKNQILNEVDNLIIRLNSINEKQSQKLSNELTLALKEYQSSIEENGYISPNSEMKMMQTIAKLELELNEIEKKETNEEIQNQEFNMIYNKINRINK